MQNKKDRYMSLGCTGMVITIIGFFGSMVFPSLIMCVVCFVGLAIFMIGVIGEKLEQNAEKVKVQNDIQEIRQWFDKKIKEYGIDTKNVIDMEIRWHDINFGYGYYYWVKDNALYLFMQCNSYIKQNGSDVKGCEEKAVPVSIPISKIEYFKATGDISYSTKISNTGIDVKGMAVGAAIAGNVGAVVGGRPKIKATAEEHDNRAVELKYCDSNGKLCTLNFKHGALGIFRGLFPEKEYEYTQAIKGGSSQATQEGVHKGESPTDIEEKFQQLQRLKNAGLITGEEFSAKREELLKQI